MKLKDLFEAKNKDLIGLKIEEGNELIEITSDTPNTLWNGNFDCGPRVKNLNLKSLNGCPKEVKGFFDCGHNQLTSLEGCPENVGKFFGCNNNKLTSLKDIHKHVKSIGGKLFAHANPIKSHVLGVLLINGCIEFYIGANISSEKSPDHVKVSKIINKYLPNTRGHKAVAECQDELIEADLDEYAQL